MSEFEYNSISLILVCFIKSCGDAVLRCQVFSRRTHLLSTLYFQLVFFSSPCFCLFPPSLPTYLPHSLPPSFLPQSCPLPPNLMSGHVWALSMPLAWHDTLWPQVWEDDDERGGSHTSWFTCALLAWRGRLVASIPPHYRMNISGPIALFGWHCWKARTWLTCVCVSARIRRFMDGCIARWCECALDSTVTYIS